MCQSRLSLLKGRVLEPRALYKSRIYFRRWCLFSLVEIWFCFMWVPPVYSRRIYLIALLLPTHLLGWQSSATCKEAATSCLKSEGSGYKYIQRTRGALPSAYMWSLMIVNLICGEQHFWIMWRGTSAPGCHYSAINYINAEIIQF